MSRAFYSLQPHYLAERVDWLPGRSIAPPRLRPWVNACDRHPIAMPPRKPLYILAMRGDAAALVHARFPARKAVEPPPRSPPSYLIPLINVHALPRAFGDSVEPEEPLDMKASRCGGRNIRGLVSAKPHNRDTILCVKMRSFY
ncbi:hypothetical protein PUN28_018673 [Cardiocondyla obscurior]|uniref:Uncharacterized protein n=1 Tax=Cardiocondyla obscurior TaxID=286306 RepID=A0AAW2EIW8_9HYME